MSKLKECPFCGDKPIHSDHIGIIRCPTCKAETPDENNTWNTRTPTWNKNMDRCPINKEVLVYIEKWKSYHVAKYFTEYQGWRDDLASERGVNMRTPTAWAHIPAYSEVE